MVRLNGTQMRAKLNQVVKVYSQKKQFEKNGKAQKNGKVS